MYKYNIMPKSSGILSVDPSWRGMGWAANPMGCASIVGVSDITQGYKTFSNPKRTAILVRDWVDVLLEENPSLHIVDTLVIESQWKTNMKMLQHSVANALINRIPTIKRYITVTAYAAKSAVKAVPQGSHNANKKDIIKVVSSSPDLLLYSLTQGDDNIADAIALLNAAVTNHKLTMTTPSTTEYIEYADHPCTRPGCKESMSRKISHSEKNPDRPYWSCDVTDCKGFVFEDEWDNTTKKRKKKTWKESTPPSKVQRPNDDAIMTILRSLDARLAVLAETLGQT